jgi:hypothetical protein
VSVVAEDVVAPLGRLELDGWSLRAAGDGWLELEATSPAFLGGLAVNGTLELLRGDELRRELGGPVVLEVLA